MKKKIGAKVIAGVMACAMAAVALTACGGKTAGEFKMPSGGFDTDTPVTIKFYHTMGAELRKVLDGPNGNDGYIAEFQKLYPNITVLHEQVGGYDDVRDQLKNEIVGGNQPNIAYCYPDHVALYNRANTVQSLDDFLPGGAYADTKITRKDGTEVSLGLTAEEKATFIEGYYNEGKQFGDGKMYTMPFTKSTEVLYYDKTFFDANNLEVPTTWDEMEAVCERIKTEIDPASTPLGYDSEANWFITMCEQYASGYTSSEDPKYIFDNDTNRAFVKKFKGWYDKGYVTTQEIYGKYTSYLFTSTTGTRCYMCIGSSAGATSQRPAMNDSGYPFKVDIAPIPQVDAKNPKVISQGPSVCIFKKSNPQEVMASWLFVKYLTTNIDFQAEFSGVSGYVPVLKEETMRKNAVFAQSLDTARQDNPAIKNDNTRIAALSMLVCMEQEKAYYTSPAFVGSSTARDQVGELIQTVFINKDNLAIDDLIDKAFKAAIEECEYFSG